MKKAMPFSKEDISTANRTNLIDFARSHGYILENGGRRALHAKQSGGLYFFKDNNKYYHFSTDSSGGPIDFVMQFLSMEFKEAVAYLLETGLPQHQSPLQTFKERGQLILPDKAPNFRRVAWYLIHVRGIDPEIVSALMHENKLYQQDKTGNCVFVGYDQDGKAKYCSIRGTTPSRPFKQDREFSDKSYPFHLTGHEDSRRVYMCESPIDAMSRATFTLLSGQDWKADHYLSLGCLSDQALQRYLQFHPIVELVFCLDNDEHATYHDGRAAPNWGQVTAVSLSHKYTHLGYNTFTETPRGKDVNEDLQALINMNENTLQEHYYEISSFHQ